MRSMRCRWPLQGKLLTALEAKRVRRLGAVAEQAVDVKLIAATQAELQRAVQEGRFRADLYHRLGGGPVELPPLRRGGKISWCWRSIICSGMRRRTGCAPKRLSRAAEAWLQGYGWPGNVRELSHLMERVTLLTRRDVVDRQTLERLCLPRPQPQGSPRPWRRPPRTPSPSMRRRGFGRRCSRRGARWCRRHGCWG